MRWLAILFVVAACSQKVPRKPYRPPPPMGVEDVATWFMKAALSGDDATARTLVLRHDQIASFSKQPDTPEGWETTVKTALDDLAREGNGEDNWKVSVSEVEKTTLEPDKDQKVTTPVQIAIVKLTVNGSDEIPFLFVYTPEGWKFSPKK